MRIQTFATLFVACLSLIACDKIGGKHEIVRAGNQTFLLNNATGEAKLIDGTSLIAIKPVDIASGNEKVKKAKVWPESSINDLKDVKFRLRTKYRDGSLLWVIEARPFAGGLEQAYKATQVDARTQPTVLFELYDDEGFKVGEPLEVRIKLGSRTVNEKNEVIELNWSGARAMSVDAYSAAAFVSTRWYGFGKD